jgi:hypothetical protein
MASIEERIGKDGKKTYRVKIRLQGHAPDCCTFDRKQDAKNWAQKTEADMKAGRHFGVSRRHKLAELIEKYVARELPKLKSRKDVEARLKWWQTKYGTWPLSNLTPDVIADARDLLKATPVQRSGRERTGPDVNRIH